MNDSAPPMTSHRPYLLRAMAEWIADNAMTPHILVDATQPGVQVPASAVKEGKVVLNIAQRAVAHLVIDNDEVAFSARFGGVSYPVRVPISAVLAIYSRETGQGMALPEDVNPASESKVVAPSSAPQLATSSDMPPDDDTPPPTKRPPFLRVVK